LRHVIERELVAVIAAHLLPDSDRKQAASRLSLLIYMNKTVRFFGRIVARPIQPSLTFLGKQSRPSNILRTGFYEWMAAAKMLPRSSLKPD
jgi:hypothetical protein